MVRAGLPLPALCVLNPSDGAPDGSVEEGGPRRPLRIRCDARDQRMDVRVAGSTEMLGPDHLVTAQARLLEHDRKRLLDVADCRLLTRSPRQHDVLDRAAGAGSAHCGGNHLRDLPRSRVGDEMELALSQDIAALGLVRAAVDIGGQLRHLPGDRRAVETPGHALADHDGGSARCAMAERMSASAWRPLSAMPGVRMPSLASPPSRRNSRISPASTYAVMWSPSSLRRVSAASVRPAASASLSRRSYSSGVSRIPTC